MWCNPLITGRRGPRIAAVAACILGLSLGGAGAQAQASAVTPPCGTAPVPAYPALDAAPALLTGPGTGLPARLDLAHCVYWDARAKSLLVLLAGRFRDDAGVQDILARFGAISRRTGMLYRSIGDSKSEPMITAAAAVTGPDAETRRGDFSVTELADGAPHYFVQQETVATGEIVYRLQVREITPRRLVLTIENTSPVRNYFIRLYDPGDLSATYYLDRLGPGEWGFYSLSGIEETSATGTHRDADAERAVAEFRHIVSMAR